MMADDNAPILNPENQEEFIKQMVARQQQQQPLIHINTAAPASDSSSAPAPVKAAPAPLIKTPPTDQQEYENKMNPGAVISAKLAAHTDSINNPFLRVGAKILSRVPQLFGDAGLAANPDIAEGRSKAIMGPEQYAQERAKTRLEGAQATEAEARAKQEASGQAGWKPAVGEQYTAYNKNPDGSQGAPAAQLWINEKTGAQEWRPVPAVGGAPLIPAQTAQQQPVVGPQARPAAPQGGAQPVIAPAAEAAPTPQATPLISAPQGGAQTVAPPPGLIYGTQATPKAGERPIGDTGVKRFQGDAAEAAKGLKGISVPAPAFDANDLPADAQAKLAAYKTQIAEEVRQRDVLSADARKVKEQEDTETRKQTEKDKRTYGSAFDPQTNERIYTNLDDANKKGLQGFEEMKGGQIDKAKGAARQFNDVQTNVSGYVKALQNYQQQVRDVKTAAKDQALMGEVLNKAGLFDAKLQIGEGGKVEIPLLSGALEALSRFAHSTTYNSLSPQGKQLIINYRAALAAVPAYVKALTDTGRSNKEVMDLELDQIPKPVMDPRDALEQMAKFQRNIDIGMEGRVHFVDLPSTQSIREKIEGKPEEPKQELPKDVQQILQSNPFGKIKPLISVPQ
jgi:hypothetical protein